MEEMCVGGKGDKTIFLEIGEKNGEFPFKIGRRNLKLSKKWRIQGGAQITERMNATKSHMQFRPFAGDAILCSNFFCFYCLEIELH